MSSYKFSIVTFNHHILSNILLSFNLLAFENKLSKEIDRVKANITTIDNLQHSLAFLCIISAFQKSNQLHKFIN